MTVGELCGSKCWINNKFHLSFCSFRVQLNTFHFLRYSPCASCLPFLPFLPSPPFKIVNKTKITFSLANSTSMNRRPHPHTRTHSLWFNSNSLQLQVLQGKWIRVSRKFTKCKKQYFNGKWLNFSQLEIFTTYVSCSWRVTGFTSFVHLRFSCFIRLLFVINKVFLLMGK